MSSLWKNIIIRFTNTRNFVRNNQSLLLRWGPKSAGAVVFLSGLDFVWEWNVDCEKEVTYWSDVSDVGNKEQNHHPSERNEKQTKEGNSDEPTITRKNDNKNKGLDVDLCCDVCIIGGGMAGLHTALALKELSSSNQTNSSKRVIVLELSHDIGQSASGMSKGLVVSGVQVPTENIQPPEFASMIESWTHQAFQRLIHDIIEKYDIKCQLEKGGGLLEASIHPPPNHENDGDDIISASQVVEKLGTKPGLYKSGEYDDECVGINPLALTRGLAKVCQSLGVLIYTQTKATSIVSTPAKMKKNKNSQDDDNEEETIFTVDTDKGAKVYCKDVVLCTGANQITSNLSPQLAHATVPIHTWMVATQPLGNDCPIPLHTTTDDNNDINTSSLMAGDDYVSLNYWRRTVDGRLLFGSLAYAYPVPSWFAEWRLKSALLQIYPQLVKSSDFKFDCVWTGTLSFSRHALPLIGKDTTNGVWYATAFAGHGIVPTTMAGTLLANAILKKDDSSWRMFHHYNYGPKHCLYPFSRMSVQALLLLYNVVDWLHVNTNLPIPQLPRPW